MCDIKYKHLIKKIKKDGTDGCLNFLKASSTTSSYNFKDLALKRSVDKILKEYKNLNKSVSRPNFQQKLDVFMETKYVFPKSVPFSKRKDVSEKVLEDVPSLDSVKDISISLAQELKNSLQSNKQLQVENTELKGKVKTRTYKITNYPRLLRENCELKHEVRKIMTVKNNTIKRERAAKNYIIKQNDSLKAKLTNLELQIASLREEISEKEMKLDDNVKDLNDTLEENEYLRLLVNDNQINLFDEECKIYTPDTQECVYELLNLNVTSSKVSPVIQAVLKLVNLKPNKLPSVQTVNNMNIQRLILAQKQLGEVLPVKKNVCLLSDETSKFGKKIEGFHVQDEEGQLYVLGLRQMVTKSAQDTLTTFQTILSDIDQVSTKAENSVSKHILLNIVSTMSDRAATQQKFNELLQEYRKLLVMEDIGQAWYDMSYDEQMAISKLNNFFCGLHALVHIAETASNCLKVVEAAFFDDPPIFDPTFRKTGESGATRLVRTVSKGFACGGDEKCGVYGSFYIFVKDFLKEKKIRSVPIQRFHGNRFNILFANAANIFFLHEHVKEYLNGDDSNRLLKSIKHDVNTPEYVAGLKALGLISYLVTTPLWSFVEDKDVHIMDSSAYYDEIITFLNESITNIQDFIEGKRMLSFANEAQLVSDEIFKALTKAWEHDDKVITILNTLLPGICETVKKLFSDFLENGQWSNVTPAKRECTRSVPKNNKFSESIFGHVDRILREKPNISIISQEAYIMFCHNKTLKWLEGKNAREKSELLSEARKDVKKLRSMFLQRRIEIEERRKILLREKFEAAENKEQRRVQKLENFTNEILTWGLWQSVEDVDFHLSLYKFKKDKIAAIKAQLNFRNNVLHQKPRDMNNVYAITKMQDDKRVNLSVEELTENVKKLVRHALSKPSDQEDNNGGLVLIGRDIRMKFEKEVGSEWVNGHVISKVIKKREYKSGNLQSFLRKKNTSIYPCTMKIHSSLCSSGIFLLYLISIYLSTYVTLAYCIQFLSFPYMLSEQGIICKVII